MAYHKLSCLLNMNTYLILHHNITPVKRLTQWSRCRDRLRAYGVCTRSRLARAGVSEVCTENMPLPVQTSDTPARARRLLVHTPYALKLSLQRPQHYKRKSHHPIHMLCHICHMCRPPSIRKLNG